MAVKNEFSAKTYIHLGIIAIFGFLIYSNTFHADFVFDDQIYIIDNPAIKDFSYFLDPLKVLELTQFTSDFTYAFITRIAGYFTVALNYHLHGLDVTGYHLFNILVHIVNGLLVYSLVRLIFHTPFFSDVKPVHPSSPLMSPGIFALCSALIFISHPVQTQAVTYIIQRWTSLATFFFLLSMATYVKSRLTSTVSIKYALYGIALVSAVMAMMTKEISFTLPVMITLIEIFFFHGKYGRRVLRLLPFALTMLVIPTALIMAEGGFSLEDIDDSMNILASYPDMERMDYLFTQFRVIVTYIRLLILPINQNLDYDYPVYQSFLTPPVFLSFLLLLLLFSLGFYTFSRSKERAGKYRSRLILVSFGIFWFFITLSIESSIIPIKDIIFEHRLYLPSVGFIIAVMASIAIVIQRINSRTAARAAIAAVSSAILILSGAAYARNSVWKTNISLWKDVVRKSPLKARAHNNLAVAYEEKGLIDDAIKEYLLAIQADPDYAEAHYNLGLAYDEKDRSEDAINELITAVEIDPAYGPAYNNLGIIYGGMGRTEDAIRQFLKLKKINPKSVKAHNNLGIMYDRQGRTEDAIVEFISAIELNPDYAEAYYNLGITYRKQGRIEEATEKFQTTLELNPKHKGARRNLKNILRMKR